MEGVLIWPRTNTLKRMSVPVGILSLGMTLGWVSWGLSDKIWPLCSLLIFPVIWGLSGSRKGAWAFCLGYFLGASRGLPAGAVVFFGDESPEWWGVAMWVGASVIQSIPFGILWSPSRLRRAFGLLFALIIFTLPPLGIIGWVNPLTAAGALFPGAGWLGLLICLALYAFLAQGRWIVLAPAVLLAAGLNFAAKDLANTAPVGWIAQDTHFSNLWNGGANLASQRLSSLSRAQWLLETMAELPENTNLVLPETLLGRWDGVLEAMLAMSEQALREKGSRVLVGAEMANGLGGYKNGLLVLGNSEGESRSATQSMPVPISMWKPWATDGADADFTGKGSSIVVGQVRISASICYEQLVGFSALRLMLDKPDLIVAVSNVWWATASNIPMIQQQSIKAFARLFNVPVLISRNT
jgi:hypothetical protein